MTLRFLQVLGDHVFQDALLFISTNILLCIKFRELPPLLVGMIILTLVCSSYFHMLSTGGNMS